MRVTLRDPPASTPSFHSDDNSDNDDVEESLPESLRSKNAASTKSDAQNQSALRELFKSRTGLPMNISHHPTSARHEKITEPNSGEDVKSPESPVYSQSLSQGPRERLTASHDGLLERLRELLTELLAWRDGDEDEDASSLGNYEDDCCSESLELQTFDDSSCHHMPIGEVSQYGHGNPSSNTGAATSLSTFDRINRDKGKSNLVPSKRRRVNGEGEDDNDQSGREQQSDRGYPDRVKGGIHEVMECPIPGCKGQNRDFSGLK